MIRDKIGQKIRPGCLIAYGHLLGRCAGLRIGKVLAVEEETECGWGKPVQRYKITVRGTEDYRRPEGGPAFLTSRNGFLRFPDRIVVLDPEKVDPAFRAVLDPLPLE